MQYKTHPTGCVLLVGRGLAPAEKQKGSQNCRDRRPLSRARLHIPRSLRLMQEIPSVMRAEILNIGLVAVAKSSSRITREG